MGFLKFYISFAVIAWICMSITGKLICHSKKPFVINGTQPPSELRCPHQCNCTYCALKGNVLDFVHDIDCSQRKLKRIPAADTVPTDARFYFLENNDIKSVKNNSFETLSDLVYLKLNSNQLTYKSMDSDAFRGLQRLRFLSFNANLQLNKLLTWFNDLTSLEMLHLQNCGLTTVTNDVFKYCKSLTKIDLAQNAITDLPPTLFQNLPALNYLYIHGNRIRVIPNHAFRGTYELKRISITDNLLNTISEQVGFQNLSKLYAMNVSYNPFACNCDIIWFINWIHTTNVTLDYNNAKCVNPSQWHLTKLIDFDPYKLQCNKLIWVLKIVIPSAISVVFVVLIGSLRYYFRYDIRYWIQRKRLRMQYERLDQQGPLPINGENIRYDVFVAYNSKDQQWVFKVLQPALENERNFKLCVDYRDFLPGEAVVDNIANAVKFSRKVLLVVTKNFAKSEWCYFELEMARMRMFDNHEDILIIVLLEKVPSKDMPILLHKILTKKTYIEWEEHPNRQALFWAKLEAALLSPNCPRDRLLDNNNA